MKKTKVIITPEAHDLLIKAQAMTGISRLDIALGAVLTDWLKNEEPEAVADDMLKGLPEFMDEYNRYLRGDELEPEPKLPKKKKRKPRPPGSSKGTA
ncbi:unnamed protein product [marine sediment metagenome]|uniref:Uncharacterized protein n=1 Tax=marine sediment metagenome TaxID=412755 RepID=X0U7R7_9ZZZZ